MSNSERSVRLNNLVLEADTQLHQASDLARQFAVSSEAGTEPSVCDSESIASLLEGLARTVQKLATEVQAIAVDPPRSLFNTRLTR